MRDLAAEAQALKHEGRFAEALQLRLLLEKEHDDQGADPKARTSNLNMLTLMAVLCEHAAEAERAARKCVEVYKSDSTPKEETRATYLGMLASVLAERGKFDEAVLIYEEALIAYAHFHDWNDSYMESCKLILKRMRNKETGRYLSRQ